MDIEYFLRIQRESVGNIVNKEIDTLVEIKLYKNILNEDLRYIFAGLHHEMNRLFRFMNDKAKPRGNYSHFNAEPSRELLKVIEIYTEMQTFLEGTQYSFSLEHDYVEHLKISENFLSESGGSHIPESYNALTINKYAPIFKLNETIDVKNSKDNSPLEQLHLIGSGSYANVYKYKDTFYNCNFAVKKLQKDLRDDEIERFHNEFRVLEDLNSPYVLKVYHFDESKQQYVMELADDTLLNYLDKNPNLGIKRRRSIAQQILSGFRYLHSKQLLHRDIAYNNVLVFLYDDTVVIKISDLGLVKQTENNLTLTATEVKGSLADPSLSEDGFKNYSMCHEIYALTRLLYFVMTNKKTLGNFPNESIRLFIQKGTNIDKTVRYKDDREILEAFNSTNWYE